MTFEALNERYQSLAAMVTSGMDSCAAGQAQSGQTEKIECTFPQGTLVLTTYSSVAELQAARKRRLNDAEGTIVSDVESGAYYRFDPTTAEPESTAPPILYWDSQAGVQSAELTGDTGVKADQLDPAFVAVSATVTPPDGPTDIAVQDFNSLFTVINCTRIPTEIGGETEESECQRSGRRTWVGKFAKVNDLRQYRSNAKTLAGQDDDLVVDYWYNDDNSNGQQDDDEPEQGKIFGYIEEQDERHQLRRPLHRRPGLPLLPADVRQGPGRPREALRPDLPVGLREVRRAAWLSVRSQRVARAQRLATLGRYGTSMVSASSRGRGRGVGVDRALARAGAEVAARDDHHRGVVAADLSRLLQPLRQLVADPVEAAAAAEVDELLAGLAPPAFGVDAGRAEAVGAEERQRDVLDPGVDHRRPQGPQRLRLAERAGVHAVELGVVRDGAQGLALVGDEDGVAVADLEYDEQVAGDRRREQRGAVGPQRVVDRGGVPLVGGVERVGLDVVADLGDPVVDDRGRRPRSRCRRRSRGRSARRPPGAAPRRR